MEAKDGCGRNKFIDRIAAGLYGLGRVNPQVLDNEKDLGRSPLAEPSQEVDQAVSVEEACDDLKSHFPAVEDMAEVMKSVGPRAGTSKTGAQPAGAKPRIPWESSLTVVSSPQ